MPTTEDTELFEDRWKEHTNELQKLGLSLPPERISDLQDRIEELDELIEVAAENMEDNA